MGRICACLGAVECDICKFHADGTLATPERDRVPNMKVGVMSCKFGFAWKLPPKVSLDILCGVAEFTIKRAEFYKQSSSSVSSIEGKASI